MCLIIYSVEYSDFVTRMEPAWDVERPEYGVSMIVDFSVMDAFIESQDIITSRWRHQLIHGRID